VEVDSKSVASMVELNDTYIIDSGASVNVFVSLQAIEGMVIYSSNGRGVANG
jgi:hypothetical protein